MSSVRFVGFSCMRGGWCSLWLFPHAIETQTKISCLTCLWVHFLSMVDIVHLPQLNVKISAHFKSIEIFSMPAATSSVGNSSHLHWYVDRGLLLTVSHTTTVKLCCFSLHTRYNILDDLCFPSPNTAGSSIQQDESF